MALSKAAQELWNLQRAHSLAVAQQGNVPQAGYNLQIEGHVVRWDRCALTCLKCQSREVEILALTDWDLAATQSDLEMAEVTETAEPSAPSET